MVGQRRIGRGGRRPELGKKAPMRAFPSSPACETRGGRGGDRRSPVDGLGLDGDSVWRRQDESPATAFIARAGREGKKKKRRASERMREREGTAPSLSPRAEETRRWPRQAQPRRRLPGWRLKTTGFFSHGQVPGILQISPWAFKWSLIKIV